PRPYSGSASGANRSPAPACPAAWLKTSDSAANPPRDGPASVSQSTRAHSAARDSTSAGGTRAGSGADSSPASAGNSAAWGRAHSANPTHSSGSSAVRCTASSGPPASGNQRQYVTTNRPSDAAEQ